MASKESKRYIATAVENLGKIGETTRGRAIFIASDDKEAFAKAKDWLRENNLLRTTIPSN